MMKSWGLTKNCCVNSYYGKIGVEKFERERELESTFYNHIDAKIRINSLAPPLLQLLLSKRSLLLPAATSALLLTQRTPRK